MSPSSINAETPIGVRVTVKQKVSGQKSTDDNIFVAEHQIRNMFSRALSDMYKKEVPLYGDLMDIVSGINQDVLAQNPELESELGNLDRLTEERHGAIRLGKPEELGIMARLFDVMGMQPVGYYDLSVAGLPIHSTAFRPIDNDELAKNPFRVFTSLLRTDLLNEQIRSQAEASLKDRQIFTPGALELIEVHKREGGLTVAQAEAFIREALETFRWHSEARVWQQQYEKFLECSSLVADIVSFKGPHINHLTPRVLDIQALHKRMGDMGIETIPEIQGPPTGWPILLQQTSFRAIVETIRFPKRRGGFVEGRHRARFGEIEQRHTSLKPEGMAIYDRLIAKAKEQGAELKKAGEEVYRYKYPGMLADLFSKEFPAKTHEELRRQNLGYFIYELTEKGRQHPEMLRLKSNGKPQQEILNSLIGEGLVTTVPITYEDFLPVSAAGIFKSNLDEKSGLIDKEASSNREMFEEALGVEVVDYHTLYREQEEHSICELFRAN